MNDLISKNKLLASLINCKKLTIEGFEEVVELIEHYPIDVDMDRVKEQISNVDIPLHGAVIKSRLMDILNNGGV